MVLWKFFPGKLPPGKFPPIKLPPPPPIGESPSEKSNKIPTWNSPTHFIN